MYVTVNEQNEIEVFVEEKDSCYTCSNMNVCPLLASLQNEAVILRYDNIDVSMCGMYEGISILELIKDNI